MSAPVAPHTETLPHYVREAPFDPYADDLASKGSVLDEASQLRLMWWRFRSTGWR